VVVKENRRAGGRGGKQRKATPRPGYQRPEPGAPAGLKPGTTLRKIKPRPEYQKPDPGGAAGEEKRREEKRREEKRREEKRRVKQIPRAETTLGMTSRRAAGSGFAGLEVLSC